MSGTSLDGVDAALLETDGKVIFGFGRTDYRPYSGEEQAVLKNALGQWDGPDVKAAAQVVEYAHTELLGRFPEAELIGFHGQTVAHDPKGRGTLQVGSGQTLCEALGKTVIWDFRTSDVKLGGQGAPLAPFYHHALARYLKLTEPLAVLNLGGVGNITFVDPRIDEPQKPGACLAFDTGPANAPLNDLLMDRRGRPVDRDGELAQSGEVNPQVLRELHGHDFFTRVPPKSLDRNDFAHLVKAVGHLSNADAAATLTAAIAVGVVRAMDHAPWPVERLLVTGGGRKNPVLMRMIAMGTKVPVQAVEEVGLDGDMLEAQAFGYLAVRVLNGMATTCPSTTGVMAMVGGGQVSRPD
jgi:anhydro-N-acetylmuramic acid kinase